MIVRDFKEVAAQPSGEAAGVSLRWVISQADGAPNFAMRVLEVEPGCATPYHQHEWEHEVFVIEGQGAVRWSGGEQALRYGSVVFVPGGEMHQFINRGSELLRFLCLIPHTKRA